MHADDDWALQLSANIAHLDVAQWLLHNVADLQARNEGALRSCTENGHFPMVQLLIQNGADPQVGIEVAQNYPSIVSWIKDFQHAQHEQSLLHQQR